MTDSAEAKDRELAAVVGLCRELPRIDALAGVGVQLRDAVPRLELTTSNGFVVDVRVDDVAAEFVWRPSFQRHPVSDLPGAARALKTYLRECGHRPPDSGGCRE